MSKCKIAITADNPTANGGKVNIAASGEGEDLAIVIADAYVTLLDQIKKPDVPLMDVAAAGVAHAIGRRASSKTYGQMWATPKEEATP